MISNKDIDLGVNAEIVTHYNITGFEYTVPYMTDELSVLVPKSVKVPHWWTLFISLDA
jgi:hypothetical protein